MKKNRNILVTGASGFIGTHFCEQSVAKGYQVYALVRDSSPGMEALQKTGARIITGDVLNASRLRVSLNRLKEDGVRIDTVVHAAGLTKARKREDFMQVNYTGTQNLLDALVDSETFPEKFIFLSSLAACGPEKYGHTIDSGQHNPVTHYGESKLRAEMLLRAYPHIPHIILRPTAVYGPGEKDLLSVFKLISKGINPVIGFHPQQLTFIYVNDLVALMLAAIESPQKDKTYFATDGKVYDKYSFGKQIAHLLHKKVLSIKIPAAVSKSIAFFSQSFKKQAPLNLQKHKELVAGSWNCNAQGTFDELHYQPAYDLQKGVDETIRWYKEHHWIK